jgi:hypothetical protein
VWVAACGWVRARWRACGGGGACARALGSAEGLQTQSVRICVRAGWRNAAGTPRPTRLERRALRVAAHADEEPAGGADDEEHDVRRVPRLERAPVVVSKAKAGTEGHFAGGAAVCVRVLACAACVRRACAPRECAALWVRFGCVRGTRRVRVHGGRALAPTHAAARDGACGCSAPGARACGAAGVVAARRGAAPASLALLVSFCGAESSARRGACPRACALQQLAAPLPWRRHGACARTPRGARRAAERRRARGRGLGPAGCGGRVIYIATAEQNPRGAGIAA